MKLGWLKTMQSKYLVSKDFSFYASVKSTTSKNAIFLIHGLAESPLSWKGLSDNLDLNSFILFRSLYDEVNDYNCRSVSDEIRYMEYVIKNICKKYNIDKVIIAGHSLGAYITNKIEMKDVDIVGKVLISPFYKLHLNLERFDIKNGIEKGFYNETDSQKILEFKEELFRFSDDIIKQDFLLCQDLSENNNDELIPKLVIRPMDDKTVSKRQITSLIKNNNNIRLCCIEKAGHNVFFERPFQTSQVITSFIDRILLK